MQGGLFQVTRIGVSDLTPEFAAGKAVRAWDLAATPIASGNDPDWTVGLKLLRESSGRWVVLDIVRLRGTPQEVERAIVEAARIDGRTVAIGLPEDPGQAGKLQVSYLARLLAGHHVKASRESGSKLIRATPVASQVEAGNVMIIRANWNHAFLSELQDFPFGRKDDQVDALARAFAMLTDPPSPARRSSVPLLAR